MEGDNLQFKLFPFNRFEKATVQ